MNKKLKFALAALALVGILIAGKVFHAQELLRKSLVWSRGLGPEGVILFVGIYVAACVLFLPGLVIIIGGAVLWRRRR